MNIPKGQPGNIEALRREKAEAEAVLASDSFQRARNPHRLLSYICELYFAGESARIKEYSIGVEALGRGSDFDPSSDTVVRVEASRLRRRLSEYYSGEGADHALQLVLPKSGYVPQFVPRPAAKQEVPAIEPRPVSQPPRSMLLRAALGLVAVLLAGSLWWLFHNAGRAAKLTPVAPSGAVETIRILAGYMHPEFVDSLGRKWLGDHYFSGGQPSESVGGDIIGVLDPTLYHTARLGNFRYDIPLQPGIYELRLLFAETVWGKGNRMYNGETTRTFHVLVNGATRLSFFDMLAQAGAADTPADRVLKDISPAADGYLHLEFRTISDQALLNGIEIVPGIPGKLRPFRILAGGQSFTDRSLRTWEADRYFIGGRPIAWLSLVKGTPDPEVYRNERWGRFSYAIPVAPNSHYTVGLRFAESHWGPSNPGGLGPLTRLFDVYCNGVALLRGFDVFKEAGGENQAVDKVFYGVQPTAQAQIVLSFVPVRDYATVRAIEVIDEGQ